MEVRMKSLYTYSISLYRKNVFLCWLCGCCVLLFSCIEVPVEEHSTEAYLIIHPDKSDYPVLPALMYHFYSMDGKSATPICLSCDGKGRFEGAVPAGTYRVIATNLNAEGVIFENMNSHSTAMVRALDAGISQRNVSATILNQPGQVYSVTMGDFIATDKDTAYHYPQPALLTKTLTLRFKLDEELQSEVNGLTGILRGVYPMVYLYSCDPVASGVNNSPSMAVNFQTTPSGDVWQAGVSLFGVCNPEHGDTYRNVLYVTLEKSDGTTAELEVELTNILSDIIENNNGEIPVEIPVEIKITETEIGIQGEAVPWKSGGDNGGEVPLTKQTYSSRMNY